MSGLDPADSFRKPKFKQLDCAYINGLKTAGVNSKSENRTHKGINFFLNSIKFEKDNSRNILR